MSSAVQMGAACPAVPVRTVGEQSYRIKELKLRFYNCQTMYAPKDEVNLLAAHHYFEPCHAIQQALHS